MPLHPSPPPGHDQSCSSPSVAKVSYRTLAPNGAIRTTASRALESASHLFRRNAPIATPHVDALIHPPRRRDFVSLLARSVAVLSCAFAGLLFRAPALAQGQGGSPRKRGVLIPIIARRWGFEPATLTIRPGRVMIAVYNRSGLPELNLSLDVVRGQGQPSQRLKQDRLRREQKKWADVVDLTPGVYTVSEENHPKFTCEITVTNRG